MSTSSATTICLMLIYIYTKKGWRWRQRKHVRRESRKEKEKVQSGDGQRSQTAHLEHGDSSFFCGQRNVYSRVGRSKQRYYYQWRGLHRIDKNHTQKRKNEMIPTSFPFFVSKPRPAPTEDWLHLDQIRSDQIVRIVFSRLVLKPSCLA